MKNRLLFWSVSASLAGFLFGFDTIVISGAEQKIQSPCDLDSAMHGLCMAEALSPSIIFGFFCFMMVLQLLWVKLFVPETKGIILEEMQARLGIAKED